MLYTKDDYIKINELRKKVWIKISIITLIFISAIVVSSILRIEWPGYVVGVLWAITVVFLWGMQGSKIRRYYLFLKDMKEGLENTTSGSFVEIDSSVTSRELVDFYTIIFNDDNADPESPSRKLYFDANKGLPSFKKGDMLALTLFGNNVKDYKII